MGVKCLAQEHNAVPRPGLEPGTSDPESSALTIRPPRLPLTFWLVTAISEIINVLNAVIKEYCLPALSCQ